jgi:RNase H-like domain found in reverse transcriptase
VLLQKWLCRSELLAPSTSNRVQAKISLIVQIKKVIVTEVLLSYLDFEKPFHIYVDASDHQLGTVIMKAKKLIAYHSRMLNATQRRHTITKHELLFSIQTLKEYKKMLQGYQIIVYTDQMNNTFHELIASDFLT